MKILVLGSGAVGTVAALKFAELSTVEQLVIADAVSARASSLADRCSQKHPNVRALTLNAADRDALVRALHETGTTILLNAALPVTNLVVMRACLEAGTDYIDMASGGAENDGIPKLDDQLALHAEFQAAGRMAVLGVGADPGTTNVYAAYAQKHLLDEVHALHIRDADNAEVAGRDGFTPLFSPWVLIDECLCGALSYENGTYHMEEALSGREVFDFPEIGPRAVYFVDHEEVRSMPKFVRGVRDVTFKLGMDDVTWWTLKVLKQTGLSRKDQVQLGTTGVIPRELVVSLLPEPSSLAGKLSGKTCVGVLAQGMRDGMPRSFYLYNVTDHDTAWRTMGVQATAYQTGIPPVIAAQLMAEGRWRGAGVFSPEQLDPDPFLERLGPAGMPWRIRDELTRTVWDPFDPTMALGRAA